MTIWRMYIACWIPKATNTHPEYITLTAFPLQQCLHERHSTLPVLLFVYVLSPLCFKFFLSSVKRYRMRQKHKWMGTWILCIDCNVKEFKWGILGRVLLLLLLLLLL